MADVLIVSTNSVKYTVIQDDRGGLRALRHGEEWQDLTGNNLVLQLAQDLEATRVALADAKGTRNLLRTERNALQAEVDRLSAESEGRRKVLFEKSEELRREWQRAETAERFAASMQPLLQLAHSALTRAEWSILDSDPEAPNGAYWRLCPVCAHAQEDGHATECALHVFLTKCVLP